MNFFRGLINGSVFDNGADFLKAFDELNMSNPCNYSIYYKFDNTKQKNEQHEQKKDCKCESTKDLDLLGEGFDKLFNDVFSLFPNTDCKCKKCSCKKESDKQEQKPQITIQDIEKQFLSIEDFSAQEIDNFAGGVLKINAVIEELKERAALFKQNCKNGLYKPLATSNVLSVMQGKKSAWNLCYLVETEKQKSFEEQTKELTDLCGKMRGYDFDCKEIETAIDKCKAAMKRAMFRAEYYKEYENYVQGLIGYITEDCH